MIHTSPTLGSLALRALAQYPRRTAFAWDGGSLCYAEVADRVARYQAAFAGAGIGKGSRVAFLSANRGETWCASMAASCSGAAITWLHPQASLADHLEQLADVDARALVVDERNHHARGAALAAETKGAMEVFTLGPSEIGVDLAAIAEARGSCTARDLATSADLAAVFYTGGTSGRSKGVMRTHAAVGAMYSSGLLEALEIPERPRYLAIAPMSHVGGTKFLPVLLRGGTIHLTVGFDPERALATIAREHVSMALFVPTMIYSLLDHPDLPHTDLSSLELVLYGAAPMTARRIAEGIARLGPIFSQFYGQTECYPISVLRRADHADAALHTSCGMPTASSEVRLLDDEGKEVAAGSPGEVCVRSRMVMDGYWKQPELTAETMRHGWLHTGDIARADERGYLHIADRKKDMIITGGFNVYPLEVESALLAVPGVLEACVFGVADDHWGEAVTAAVVVRPGTPFDEAALIQHVKAHKGSVLAPKRVHLVDALPRTPLGKIDKKKLRAEREGRGPS